MVRPRAGGLHPFCAMPVPAELEGAAPAVPAGHGRALPCAGGALLVHRHAIMNLLAGSREREKERE